MDFCRLSLPVILLLGAGLSMPASATPPVSAAASTAPSLATLQQQATTGNAAAEAALGKRLMQSKNPADKIQAVEWYRKAAAQGNADAEWALGSAYALGDPAANIQQDVPTGLKWMRKSLADGSADHMGLYGWILAVSSFHAGNKQGVQDGLKWLRRGAQGGSAQSMSLLGGLLFMGKLGVAPDKAAAEHWLLKSAKQGNAMSQESLGILYVSSGFGKPEVAKGLHWLRASAKQGDVTAEGELAALLVTGGPPGKMLVPKDPQEGVQWANKAVAKRNAVGFYALGYAYQYGEAEPKNPAKAWYNLAVAKRLDTGNQLTHVHEHLQEVATRLSAAQLDQLRAEVAKVPLPKNQSNDIAPQ